MPEKPTLAPTDLFLGVQDALTAHLEPHDLLQVPSKVSKAHPVAHKQPRRRKGGTVPEWPFADLNSAHWRLLMPQEPIQDAMNAQEQALAHGEVRIDINRDRIDPYNHTGDASLMLMLGGRWGMGGDGRGWYGCCM